MLTNDDVPLGGPSLLGPEHHVSDFDCGKPHLNEFLRRFSLENQKGGKSRTYVVTRGTKVAAFYSLAPGSVAPAQASTRVARGQGAQDIPVILLARLAVHKDEQGRGLGAQMLLDALRRALAGAEVIGGRAVLVHAKDEDARRFYLRHGFESSPTDELHLLLMMKDICLTLNS